MGFEAREVILDMLDQAIEDKAEVRVVAYDLSDPDVGRPAREDRQTAENHHRRQQGARRRQSPRETQAEKRLRASAGKENVTRQHMKSLQHNKTIVVDGPKVKKVVCGSTNFSWRGFFVQSNNAVVVRGQKRGRAGTRGVRQILENDAGRVRRQPIPRSWTDLGLKGIDARVAFSPHAKSNAC